MVNYPSVARKIELTVLYVGVATDQKRKQHTQNKHENYLFIKVYSMYLPPEINLGDENYERKAHLSKWLFW